MSVGNGDNHVRVQYNLYANGTISGSGLGVEQTGGGGAGLSLYGGSGFATIYEIMFATLGSFGSHGSVTADWATYFNMSNSAGRGWIFRREGIGGVASIDTSGNGFFNGNLTALGTIQFYTASDRRLKTDFEAITNPIEKIKSLNGYFFNYTDQAMTLGSYSSRRDVGLIAQDVELILPEATGKLWGTEFLGYKADKLIPILVEAMKQQQVEIDNLKQQLNG